MDTKIALDDEILEQATGGAGSWSDEIEFQVNVRKDDDYNSILNNMTLNHGSVPLGLREEAARLLVESRDLWGADRYYVIIAQGNVSVGK